MLVPAFPSVSVLASEEPTTPGRRGPYRKTVLTREAILSAAMDVFATRGYRAGSMREIAERVGMDQTSILHHYPTKAALLLAVMEERDRRADELIEAEHPQSLRDVPEAFLALARSNVATPGVIQLYSVLAAESVTPDHPLGDYFRDRIARVRTGFAAWFAELDAEGLLRDGVDPAFAASSFLALWEGAQLHGLIDGSGGDVTETLSRYLRLVVRDEAFPAIPATKKKDDVVE
ncbi:TetR/AcrR family transcriptional regulator [Microbacterium gilvum]|uniref:TetR/AcrR family transcriptional regulator n=1 Tax=Microbacterium gilvum TaxID=1336204 RepID=A0ABP9AGH1_9MICO